MPSQRDVNIRLAVQNADAAIQAMRSFGKEGESALKTVIKASGDLPVAGQRVEQLGQSTERSTRQSRAGLINLSNQLQDVAVQLQSGTSPFVILAQQGPQALSAVSLLLPGLGALGAGLGALVGVGAAAAGALFGLGRDTDKAKTSTELFNEAQKEASETLSATADSAEALTAKIRDLTDAQRELLKLDLKADILDSQKALEKSGSTITEQIRAIRQALVANEDVAAGVQRQAAQIRATLGTLGGAPDDAEGLASDAALSARLKALNEQAASGNDLPGVVIGLNKLIEDTPAASSKIQEMALALRKQAEEALKSTDTLARLNNELATLNGDAPGSSASLYGGSKGTAGAAGESIDRLRESLQSKLDALANTIKEKKNIVQRELGETLTALTEQRSKPGADQDVIDQEMAQAKEIAARRIALIDETARKEAEASAASAAAAQKRADVVAEQAAREAQARQSRVDGIAQEVSDLQKLDDANKTSAEAYRQVQIQIEAEQAARQLGADATPEQIKQIEDEVVARGALRDSIAQTTAARADAEQAAAQEEAKRNADLQRQADAQAKLFAEPFKNAGREIQNDLASGIKSAFDGSLTSAKDFGDELIDLFEDVGSQIAAALLVRPVVEGVTGGPSGTVAPIGAFSLASGTGGNLASLAPSLFGGGQPVYSNGIKVGTTPAAPAAAAGNVSVAGAGIGALGAGLGGYAIGQSTGSSAVGALGGAATGALIGTSILPGYGTAAGALIGGIAGFLGGAFAPNGGTHNDNYQQGFNPTTGRTVDFLNTKPSQENASAVTAVIAELATLKSGLADLGVTVKGTELTIQSGNKSGFTINGVKYGSAAEGDQAALAQLLAGAQGLSANQNLAIKNSGAKDAAGLLSDIGFAKSLDDLIRGPLTAFDTALQSIGDTFGKAADRATQLGLSTKALDAERIKEIQTLKANSNFEIDLLTGRKTQTDAAIRQIRDTYDTAAKEAQSLGRSVGTITALRKAEGAAIKQVIDDQRSQIQGQFSFLDPLRSYKASLATVEGVGSPLGNLKVLKDQFNSTRAAALKNDPAAVANLQNVSEQYRQAAYQVYGSTDRYQSVEKSIESTLDKVITKNEASEARMLAKFDALEAATIAQTKAVTAEQAKTAATFTAEIEALRRDIRISNQGKKAA